MGDGGSKLRDDTALGASQETGQAREAEISYLRDRCVPKPLQQGYENYAPVNQEWLASQGSAATNRPAAAPAAAPMPMPMMPTPMQTPMMVPGTSMVQRLPAAAPLPMPAPSPAVAGRGTSPVKTRSQPPLPAMPMPVAPQPMGQAPLQRVDSRSLPHSTSFAVSQQPAPSPQVNASQAVPSAAPTTKMPSAVPAPALTAVAVAPTVMTTPGYGPAPLGSPHKPQSPHLTRSKSLSVPQQHTTVITSGRVPDQADMLTKSSERVLRTPSHVIDNTPNRTNSWVAKVSPSPRPDLPIPLSGAMRGLSKTPQSRSTPITTVVQMPGTDSNVGSASQRSGAPRSPQSGRPNSVKLPRTDCLIQGPQMPVALHNSDAFYQAGKELDSPVTVDAPVGTSYTVVPALMCNAAPASIVNVVPEGPRIVNSPSLDKEHLSPLSEFMRSTSALRSRSEIPRSSSFRRSASCSFSALDSYRPDGQLPRAGSLKVSGPTGGSLKIPQAVSGSLKLPVRVGSSLRVSTPGPALVPGSLVAPTLSPGLAAQSGTLLSPNSQLVGPTLSLATAGSVRTELSSARGRQYSSPIRARADMLQMSLQQSVTRPESAAVTSLKAQVGVADFQFSNSTLGVPRVAEQMSGMTPRAIHARSVSPASRVSQVVLQDGTLQGRSAVGLRERPPAADLIGAGIGSDARPKDVYERLQESQKQLLKLRDAQKQALARCAAQCTSLMMAAETAATGMTPGNVAALPNRVATGISP